MSEHKAYVITYLPFPDSDMELEALDFGSTPEEAIANFQRTHSAMRVKDAKEKF